MLEICWDMNVGVSRWNFIQVIVENMASLTVFDLIFLWLQRCQKKDEKDQVMEVMGSDVSTPIHHLRRNNDVQMRKLPCNNNICVLIAFNII